MKSISLKIATTVVTGSLIISGSVTSVRAQSSFDAFGSSSSNAGSLENSHIRKLERAYQELLETTQGSANREAQAETKVLLQRALNGELIFRYNQFLDYAPATEAHFWVDRVLINDVDALLIDVYKAIEDAKIRPGKPAHEFGLAVGKDKDYYYIAGVKYR